MSTINEMIMSLAAGNNEDGVRMTNKNPPTGICRNTNRVSQVATQGDHKGEAIPNRVEGHTSQGARIGDGFLHSK